MSDEPRFVVIDGSEVREATPVEVARHVTEKRALRVHENLLALEFKVRPHEHEAEPTELEEPPRNRHEKRRMARLGHR